MDLYIVVDFFFWNTTIYIARKKNAITLFCERQFPVVLPHELVPWLHRNDAWPHDISESDLRDYWGNCKKQQLPWSDAAIDLEGSMHPFFIWGDDCQYNESYEKLIVICMGHTLDRRTFSLESCWPIIVIREVSSHICSEAFLFSWSEWILYSSHKEKTGFTDQVIQHSNWQWTNNPNVL